jgi:uncharacterized glyoxalase superfamily protein PhnB
MTQCTGDIYPALSYNDAAAAMAWLSDAFGFRELLAVPGPDGTIRHAEMAFGNGIIMLGSAREELGQRSPHDLPAASQSVCVYVADPDAHYARAKAAGAEITREIADTDHGSRGYGVRDCEGHQWYFETYRPAIPATS